MIISKLVAKAPVLNGAQWSIGQVAIAGHDPQSAIEKYSL